MINIRTISKCVGVCAFALAASCMGIDAGAQRVDVTESNSLGVTTIETTRDVDNGNNVFTLRGLSADDQELASVRLTIGMIPDLPQFLSGNAFGSELVISVAGRQDGRMVSHETELFHVQPTANSAAFLGIAAVSSTLARDANVVVAANGSMDGEVSYTTYYATSPCAPSELNVTPVADQCCYTTTSPDGVHLSQISTLFSLPTQAIVSRQGNVNGPLTPCKASDGTSDCNGAACFFGPNGFARPVVTPPVSGEFAYVGEDTFATKYVIGTHCYAGAEPTQLPPVFGNVTGTFPLGEGCPGSDGGGGNSDWDD